MLGEDDDGEDDSDDEGGKKKADPAALIKSHMEHGWPLLPSKGNMSLDDLKSVLRAYVSLAYSKHS